MGKISASDTSRAVVWGGETGGGASTTLSPPRLPLGLLRSPIFFSAHADFPLFPQCGAWSQANVASDTGASC